MVVVVAPPPALPLYFQLSVEAAALLVMLPEPLQVPLELSQVPACGMKLSLSLLEPLLLLAQLLLLPQQLRGKEKKGSRR